MIRVYKHNEAYNKRLYYTIYLSTLLSEYPSKEQSNGIENVVFNLSNLVLWHLTPYYRGCVFLSFFVLALAVHSYRNMYL